jgi:ComF family protein
VGLIDYLFPKTCINCGKNGAYFCSECINFASLDRERICPVCEKYSIGGLTHPACTTDKSLDGFTSVFAYKGIIKKGIGKLKYKFVSVIGSELVELFLSSLGEDKSFVKFCYQSKVILVPVPLHPIRERWRGFSQTKLLGKLVADNLGIEMVDLLVRIKNTKPQVGLGENDRKKNIEGAFVINPKFQILNFEFQIVLFDDVWTSGSTLKEAARTLKKAGAKNVWGLTLAR